MRPPAAAATEFTPLFDWSTALRGKALLVGFIAASTALHALCFYLFQITYPPTVALLPPPARVNLITAETEEGRVLLRWLEAEDPALSSTTVAPPEASSFDLPKPPHLPPYANHQPALKQLPPPQPDLRIPSAQPPGPVRFPRAATPAPATTTRSRIVFADASVLGAANLPAPQFTASTAESPQAAQFRLGIDARGAVQYCFLQRSSGDPALDEQARQHLMRGRFPDLKVQKSDTVWTQATIEWGNDIAASGNAPTAPTGAASP
jgi:hypothetical protein